ncbi:MAG: LamG domain-containing protein [Planctomycetes bacterium]|nr:LamG domain-containing protein [Planctomycetota bacterium]
MLSTVSGTMQLYGPQGGPFPQGTRTYRLSNQGTEPAVWRMDADDPWLMCTPSGGILAPGQVIPMVVEINHLEANALPQGTYPSALVLRTASDTTGQTFVSFQLNVLPPGGSALRFEPAGGLVIDTHVGSPVSAIDGEIEVENTGSIPFVWSASSSEAWLEVVLPTEARFNPGETDTFGVRVDEALLSGLGLGTHQGSIEIFDAGSPTVSVTVPVTVHLGANQSNRVTQGLQAEYRFDEGTGNVVHDASGVQPPLDLVIADPSAISWQPNGVTIQSPTIIATPGPASRMITRLRQTGAMTVEAWLRPANLTQAGPARILGISNGPSLRNFTLGQGLWGGQPANTFNMRTRTTATDMDGMPLLTTSAGGASLGLQHLVYVRGTDGNERLYVDGLMVSSQYKGGDLSNWDSNFRLAVANEVGASRPWLGEIFLLAVYDRVLTDGEIQQNLQAGSGASNAGHLDVQPGTAISLSAVRGQGPTSTPPAFVLSNVGGEALNWSGSSDQSWFALGTQSGSLQPGANQTVGVQLNGTAIAALSTGQYQAHVVFTNNTSNYGTRQITVTLNVTEPGTPGTGARPGPTNTGPTDPSILQTMGSMTITQNGFVLQNARIYGTIDVQANNVTIRNFIQDAGGQAYGIRCNNGNTGLVVEDGEIYNVASAHIYGGGFSAYRLNLHESGGDGFKTISNVLVEGCWVHHLGTADGAHADCNQTRVGGNLTFRGNYFDLPIDIGQPYKQNACWIVQTGEGAIDNVLIENNWLNGGNYSIFIENKWTTNNSLPNYGDPTNVRILNNRFGRDFRFGPLRATSYATISGNRWDDDDQLMTINNQ